MTRPSRTPIGLHLAQVAKVVNRAFDDTLARAGGSLPVWLVLIALKSRQTANQRQLADAVGIQGPTLTHHLNAMESAGLLTRRRDPENRRVHLVELTTAGDQLFLRLREAAMSFDRRLRAGLSDDDTTKLDQMLDRLRANVTRPAT